MFDPEICKLSKPDNHSRGDEVQPLQKQRHSVN